MRGSSWPGEAPIRGGWARCGPRRRRTRSPPGSSNALLRQIPLEPGLEQPWANEVLHTIVPVYALLDWLFAPGRRPVRWRVVGWIVVHPVLWAGYTLVRGPTVLDEGTGNAWWYPYPFLDPHASAGGYGAVAVWVVVLAAAISAMASGIVGISRGRP